jgi:hypothetical protein
VTFHRFAVPESTTLKVYTEPKQLAQVAPPIVVDKACAVDPTPNNTTAPSTAPKKVEPIFLIWYLPVNKVKRCGTELLWLVLVILRVSNSAAILIDKGLAGIEDNDVGSTITSYSFVGNGEYLKTGR